MEIENKLDYIDRFLDYLEYELNYSKNTLISYAIDIRDFENFIKREEFAEDVVLVRRLSICKNYINYLGEKNYSKKSVARKISSLRAFYNYLYEEKLVNENLFNKIPIPKVPKKLPSVITDNEIDYLFNSIDTTTVLGFRNYLILDMLYSLGLRVSEIINLNTGDVDLVRDEIKVLGKGRKERILYLHKKLKDSLSRYIKYERAILLAKGENKESNRLLINYKGGDLTQRGIRKILNEIIDKSGEHYKIHPHMLRHAFATTLLNNGANLKVVQELLGHENLKTTQIYTHISSSELIERFQKLSPRNKRETK